MNWLEIHHYVVDFQPIHGRFLTMYPRYLAPLVREALSDTPVVLLNGARQTGKSTLARQLDPGALYLTLDDASVRGAIARDAEGFITALPERVILDEVQRAPELFLALKAEVDRNRRPGRFLLTGSANVLLLPKLADSLAGRMEVLELWPLAQSELGHAEGNLVDALFDEEPKGWRLPSVERQDLGERLLHGGYPEAVARRTPRRLEAWFESYVQTVLQRDVQDLSRIEGLAELPRLLQLLAARSAGLSNVAELSRVLGLPGTTLKRYLGLFEALFLVRSVPAFADNLGKRLVKSPKRYLGDTGLLAHLLGLDAEALRKPEGLPGALVETFVFTELAKHRTWARRRVDLTHYRTETGTEVDFVLSDRRGHLVGIEVKAAGSVTPKAFDGLRQLEGQYGERFERGIVLYAGERVLPIAPKLAAVPLSALWSTPAP